MATPYRDDVDDQFDPDLEAREGDLHVRHASHSSENGYPIPIWMRESAKSFKYRWVPLPVRKAGYATREWVRGPKPPMELRIKPLCPSIQEAPLRLMDRYLPKRRHRISLLMGFYAVWFLTWSLMLQQNFSSGFIAGYGRPSNIWCETSFWKDKNGCGQNGHDCRPFSSSHLTFRCPSDCRPVQLLEPHMVGNESYVYHSLVVGGPDPEDPEALPVYRGDSYICQAAIHAGVIGNAGGCGVATLTGTHSNFHASEAHGIQSIGFPSTFPRTFTFQSLSSEQSKCPANNRWSLLTVTAVALTLLWLFTASPSVLFLSTFFIVALHTGLVGDPPSSANFHELLSTFFSRLLPAAFIAFILCRYCAIPALGGLTAQIEKPVLYLGFTFFGALNNYTFARLIPIQRLTPHDIQSQPGAPVALAIVILAILAIVCMQIHFLRLSGQLPRYLKLYAFFLLGLFILLVLPGWRLRIHHYILALLFMPGTAMQTRSALVYQGLLLGLFINGVMRWGFDSIIQTPFALGEIASGQSSPWFGATWPQVNATVLSDHGDRSDLIRFEWGDLPRDRGVDGVSILVNDVERWRGYIDEELYWHASGVTLERRGWMIQELGQSGRNDQPANEDGAEPYAAGMVGEADRPHATRDTLQLRLGDDDDDNNNPKNSTGPPPWPEPDFYRFAWMQGNTAGRYGGVGVWDEWGNWHPPDDPTTGR